MFVSHVFLSCSVLFVLNQYRSIKSLFFAVLPLTFLGFLENSFCLRLQIVEWGGNSIKSAEKKSKKLPISRPRRRIHFTCKLRAGDGKGNESIASVVCCFVFGPFRNVMRKWIIKALMFISFPYMKNLFSSKQAVENAAYKDNATAHGSSSMIMENALIIDECFVSSTGFRSALSSNMHYRVLRSQSPDTLATADDSVQDSLFRLNWKWHSI